MTELASMVQELQLAWSLESQPTSLLKVADRIYADLIGHTLLTVTRVLPGGREIERLYSTRPSIYPVGGRKPIEFATYADSLDGAKRPFLGRTPSEFRDVFADHEEITALGIGSVINLPVVYDGKVLGTVNLHDREWAYEEKHLEPGMVLARQLLPAMLDTNRTTPPS